MKGIIKKALRIGGFGLVTVLSSQVHAAGYRLEFQSASTLADGGDAAVVEDAGTNWYNSAGLVYVPQQLALSAIDLYSQTLFTGSSTAPAGALPPVATFNGTGKASSYTNIGLPGFHYAYPIKNSRYALGISVVPAWGLAEDYGNNSLLRYDLTRVYTRTIDIAPSISAKINDQWSVGVGPDFSYFTIQQANRGNITVPDSIARVVASNWGYGGHLGILYRISDATRVGLNYRSRIAMNLTGYSNVTKLGSAPNVFETNQFNVNLPQPPTTTLSIYHDVTPCWALMGTVAYDQWSIIRNTHGINYMQADGTTTTINYPQDYHNTFDLSVGTHYRITDKWLFRTSVKYQQTPTNDTYRAVVFPDGEKLGFNFGARYQMTKKTALDLIYAHVFTRTVPINSSAIPAPVTGVVTTGRSTTTIDLFGAQLIWNI